MRDEKRIPKALNVLKLCWKAFPDLRLGQLIGNALTYIDGPMPDLYYVEDKTLAEAVWAYRVKHGPPIKEPKKRKKKPAKKPKRPTRKRVRRKR